MREGENGCNGRKSRIGKEERGGKERRRDVYIERKKYKGRGVYGKGRCVREE